MQTVSTRLRCTQQTVCTLYSDHIGTTTPSISFCSIIVYLFLKFHEMNYNANIVYIMSRISKRNTQTTLNLNSNLNSTHSQISRYSPALSYTCLFTVQCPTKSLMPNIMSLLKYIFISRGFCYVHTSFVSLYDWFCKIVICKWWKSRQSINNDLTWLCLRYVSLPNRIITKSAQLISTILILLLKRYCVFTYTCCVHC